MNDQPVDKSPIEAQVVAPPSDVSVGRGPGVKSLTASVTESKWMVLGILFGVTGALGIPLLWVSKQFSLVERILWSMVVMIYTLALVGFTAAIVMWSLRTIGEAYWG